MHKTLWDSMSYLFNNNTITYNQLMVAAQKTEGKATEGKGITQVKAKAATLKEEPSELNNMKKQLSILQSMVSKNVNMGRQKGGPQGINNKGNIISLDPSLRPNLPIITAQGPFLDGNLPVQCHRCMGQGHIWQNCPTSLNFKGRRKRYFFPRAGEQPSPKVPTTTTQYPSTAETKTPPTTSNSHSI